MIIIGLTGNIASGKSTVADIFRNLGAEIIDADQLSRAVMDKGSRAWKKIVDKFGDSVLKQDGSIDRKKLGQIVFNDKKKLEELMEITHPEILNELTDRINFLKRNNPKCIVIEATLIEINGDIEKMIDRIVIVRASSKNQLSRLRERDDFTNDEAMMRIKSQKPAEARVSGVDYIIDNDSDLNNLKMQVIDIWNALTNG